MNVSDDEKEEGLFQCWNCSCMIDERDRERDFRLTKSEFDEMFEAIDRTLYDEKKRLDIRLLARVLDKLDRFKEKIIDLEG